MLRFIVKLHVSKQHNFKDFYFFGNSDWTNVIWSKWVWILNLIAYRYCMGIWSASPDSLEIVSHLQSCGERSGKKGFHAYGWTLLLLLLNAARLYLNHDQLHVCSKQMRNAPLPTLSIWKTLTITYSRANQQIPWQHRNQQCVNTVESPCSACGAQPQAHWFLL